MTIGAETEVAPSALPIGGIFARIGRLLVDVVLPPTCLACRIPVGEKGGLCSGCWVKAGFTEHPCRERLAPRFRSDSGSLFSRAALPEPPAYARARAVA